MTPDDSQNTDITRVAVVGLGSAGATLHLPALAGMSHVRLVGVVDPDSRCREASAAKFAAPGFADLGDMLQHVRPDVVVVATPPALHVANCIQALEAGAHVICEKPFVPSLAEADAVMAVAKRMSKQVAVNHEFREMPVFRVLREHINPSEALFTQVWQLIDLPTSSETGWRGAMHHRTLFEAGVHLVDFLMALYGERPQTVSATTTDAGAAGNASDAVVLVTFGFSRGRVAQLVQSRITKGARQYFEVRVETAMASWRASFGGRARLTAGLHRSTRPHVRVEFGISGMAWRETGSRRAILARNGRDPGMLATRMVLQNSIDAFRNGGTPPTSAARAREILAVTVACYTAAESGIRMTLNDETLQTLTDIRLGDDTREVAGP